MIEGGSGIRAESRGRADPEKTEFQKEKMEKEAGIEQEC